MDRGHFGDVSGRVGCRRAEGSEVGLDTVAGSLMLAGVNLLDELGFTVEAGIAIVTLLMATVLIPSLATLIGDRLWWPGHKPTASKEATDRARPAAPPFRPTAEVAPAQAR